jgi:hypothetical protein
MKTPPATPYLLPPESAVVDHPWTTEDGLEVPDRFEHWDPYTSTELFRTVEVDIDRIRESCQLGEDSALALTVSWSSDRTRLAGSSAPIELGSLSGTVRAPLTVTIPGAVAGGRLTLLTRLTVRYAGTAPSPISPRRNGAILWTQDARIWMEGAASRFPITAVDFASVGWLPDRGSWALEWDPEALDAPVLSGLRLVVNAEDPVLLQALRSGSADPRSGTIRSFVLFDVARTLIEGALRSEPFVSDPESFDDDTIGRMLFELVQMCWPGVPVTTLVARAHQQPARLTAELQAHLGVLG